MKGDYLIHAAPWIIPVDGPPVREGGVVFCGQEIVAVGTKNELTARFPGTRVEDHQQAALTPPLINAHIHLELSHLSELALQSSPATFTGWILSLIGLRDVRGAVGPHVEQAAQDVALSQYTSGVSALGDIGNTDIGTKMAAAFPGTLIAFKEYLGFHVDRLATILGRLEQENPQTRCSGHAVYSTHLNLLKALHDRAKERGHVLPIHVAEPEAEVAMIREGQGEMVEFLEERGFWDPAFLDAAGSASGTVDLLHRTDLLDEHTLCIHCVHVDDTEIELLAVSGAKVCLCPGSNRFLDVGIAPVDKFLQAGILPALGTDSRASNPELSLWREMQLLAEDHPGLDHGSIFAMATKGGAQALGIGDQAGTLATGRKAELLKVELPEDTRNEKDVMRYLVTTGSAIQPVRIEDTRSG